MCTSEDTLYLVIIISNLFSNKFAICYLILGSHLMLLVGDLPHQYFHVYLV
jgi:hypothetical protein